MLQSTQVGTLMQKHIKGFCHAATLGSGYSPEEALSTILGCKVAT